MNKIANVENVVCSVETMSRHPELYHYTKAAAFEGILGSQTLWCSHYREMLDTDELQLMRALLPPAVAPRMDAIVEKLKSEREVRIVAIPGTANLAKYAGREFPAEFDATKPLPEVRAGSDTRRRYIALFDGLGLRLPVKRVIVGPGAQQEERAARTRSILGDVPVTLSRCP
jgi:hypothetical protein